MRDGVNSTLTCSDGGRKLPAAPLIAGSLRQAQSHQLCEAVPRLFSGYSKLSSTPVLKRRIDVLGAEGLRVINVDRGNVVFEGDATSSRRRGAGRIRLIEWPGHSRGARQGGTARRSYCAFTIRRGGIESAHLAAIIRGRWHDFYREVARHGGIPETAFWAICRAAGG